MSKVTIKSRIPQIIAELSDKALDAVTDLALEIAEDARERVPVDSGQLRDAIHVEVVNDSREGRNQYGTWTKTEQAVSIVAGDTDTFYGHIVENGGVNTPARPFLIPAFEQKKQKLGEIVSEHMEDL
jgi:HK97 gp10 family phage protein